MKEKNDGPNWKKIKAEYIRGGISQRKLAKKHGVSFSTLQRKARIEGWAKTRRDVEDKAEAKLIQKTVDLRAEMAGLFEQTGLEALRAIAENFRRFPNGTGTKITRNLYKGNDGDDGTPSRVKSRLVPDTIAEHSLKESMDMLATWAKVYGMDDAGRLAREKLQLEMRSIHIDIPEDDGFLDALSACAESWEINDEPANLEDGGDGA